MLGEIIKDLREQRGLTQANLAKLLNISPSTIGMWEQNRRSPDNDALKKIADFFNVSTDYLLGRTNLQLSNTEDKLTAKDKRDIQKDLKNIMDDYREQEDGSKYYNGMELQDEDFDYLELAMQVALEKIKVKNKEKYTPNKFKK
jgi:transcriptional regulator with XRE-family HTH domain